MGSLSFLGKFFRLSKSFVGIVNVYASGSDPLRRTCYCIERCKEVAGGFEQRTESREQILARSFLMQSDLPVENGLFRLKPK